MDLITLALAMKNGGGGDQPEITVDGAISSTSVNPVENRVIAAAINQKADRADIEDFVTENDVEDAIENAVGDIVRFEYYLCSSEEYDTQTGVPTVVNPDTNHIYLVPTSGDNLLMYAYINSAFVYLGTTEMDLSGYVTNADLTDALDDYATLAALQAVSAAMPTKVSDLTNDAGYLTQHQDISGKANTADLSAAAFSGNYNDLSNKPTIPVVPSNIVTGSTKSYTIVVSNSAPAAGTPDNIITIVV